MNSPHGSSVLSSILEPLSRCLTPESARAVVGLRADPISQARIEELADKSTAGTLTPRERAEYEACVWAGQFIAILQAKARTLLKQQTISTGD